MIRNMLVAASKMLDKNMDAKVQCAKVVIDEIVAGMDGVVVIDSEEVAAAVPKKSKEKKAPSENQMKAKITADNGRIKSIEGVPLDTTMIELDGKVMTCAEAIGKTFQNGRIL